MQISSIKNISGSGKRLISNFFSLAVLQILNYLFPIITMPYLLRVIGAEKFGIIAIQTATFSYFQLLVDYGFNLSATKNISVNRDDKNKVSEIFSSVMTIKCGLLAVSLIIMVILINVITAFRDYQTIYYIAFIGLIGNAFFPVWFFQGIERMKYITYFNFFSRLAFTVLIFIVIKVENDYFKVVLLNSIASIIIGIVSVWIVVVNFRVKYMIPRFSVLKGYFLEGWYIFISTFSVNMYINSNTLILRAFTNDTVVGYYSMAEKIITAVRSLASVIFQAIYPYVCSKALESKEKLKDFYRKVFIPAVIVFLSGCLILLVFSGLIIRLMAGEQVIESEVILKILSFVPFIVVSNIPAYQTMLAYDFKKSYTSVLFTGSVLNIILNLVLVNMFSSYGTAVSVLITELYITVGLYIVLELKHPKYSLFRS
ncbi:flippase [Pseudobacteroides cellulosolvens]|uniref:Polysaccharide biosynthesis protein n=1 Tax=Pseudobacteroides cellulosolvens ATCC 35603 = DSM 2933 TaxID=398512 RepID=A0A0L6JUZ1_9FIRM|nr:flippase [Pseudobacteroides cellulosolvens]KNY29648.1 polysaccharide biosynthesis protein [Pseudobacteroides cellulosolvens ATCC 35603 = DSM 2933]